MRRVALTLFAAAVIAAVASARLLPPKAEHLTLAYTYDMYLEDHQKPRAAPVEHAKRKAIFEQRLAEIVAHNANPKRSYSRGVNHMSDWTEEERKAVRGGRHEPSYRPKRAGVMRDFVKDEAVPIASSLDWRTAQPPVLTAVKDQGMCGDCWAHAVTESIESAYARASGEVLVLSQQQVTACTPPEGSCWSCNGMYPRYAYEYASDAKLIFEEWMYPFTSYNGSNAKCINMTRPEYPLKNWVSIWGYTQIAPNNQDAIISALNSAGPLSILVDASKWQDYESGVFDGCTANITLDHAVQLVGYGHDDTLDKDYWIVRNSWSAGWGEHGFIRVLKHDQPACTNTQPLSCFNAPNQTVARSCGSCGILTDAQFPNVNY